MVTSEDWQAIALTLQLAAATTVLLLLIATPLAWWLARSASRLRPLVSALIALPLVLPPTVLGFYLLLSFAPQAWLGSLLEAAGLGSPAFSFTGLLLGSLVFSLPFAVLPLQFAFESLGRRPLEVAATLRARPVDAFLSVALPMARPGILTAAILVFAHTIGEFGVVLMIGGNIPGRTRVVSTQIYSHVEAMDFSSAHTLSVLVVAFAFLVLLALARLNRQRERQP
jgi:molybdate transport system permease protein